MKCAWIPTSLLIAFLASWETVNTHVDSGPGSADGASTDQDSGSQESAGRSKDELDRERRKLDTKRDIASAKLGIAQLELEATAGKHVANVRHAEAGVAVAAATLATFMESTMPSRLQSAELSLRRSSDRVQEAADELEQIRIMYDEQDLEDMTAEFVVSRGQRNAEHAAASLAIQEAEFDALKERELPQEQLALELALDKAEVAFAAAQLEQEIGLQRASVAIREAESAVTSLELEITALVEEGQ